MGPPVLAQELLALVHCWTPLILDPVTEAEEKKITEVTRANLASIVVPSRHASDTAYHPCTCVVPSQHASDTAYHPYACVVPSQHGSDAALTLA
ncbi:hypothetical protein O181_130302 [Austropuccinia psidii MF-1]|uniref:Secreted protein n=1 Tax=Austropuccinia psidii MF-1 TaxID=1389203 RepID=A0A9Q3QCD1_9BASI|nr:hypothetical protein [Austropuccinia psidii MF-1]